MPIFNADKSNPKSLVAKPAGGFRLIRVTQLCMIWWAYATKRLGGYLGLRVYLALHEIDERRRAAQRKRQQSGQKPSAGKLDFDQLLRELGALVGGAGGRCLKAALRRLERIGLIHIGADGLEFAQEPSDLHDCDDTLLAMLEALDRRPALRRRVIPMPRRMVRYLASGAPSAVAATAFAYSIRCLWLNGRRCSATGTCPSSFVSQIFGLHPRTIKSARKRLRDVGWVTPVEANHWFRQRNGALIVIDLRWSTAPVADNASRHGDECTGSPPPGRQKCIKSPPPIKNLQLPSGSKNQQPAAGGSAGAKARAVSDHGASLRNVRLQDLLEPVRLHALFNEASRRGWVCACEGDRLQFFGAAEHARRYGTRNVAGLFVTLVKHRRWSLLTLTDEDAARRKLAGFDSSPFRQPSGRSNRRVSTCPGALSPCPRTAQIIRDLAEQCSLVLPARTDATRPAGLRAVARGLAPRCF